VTWGADDEGKLPIQEELMKSFLGASTVVLGIAAAGFVACGGSSKEPPKNPMAELTPVERQQAEERAGKEDQRERELAAAREPRPSSGAPANANRTTTALAVSSMATARCDRELRCKNIGTNKTYLNTDECVTKVQNDKRSNLNPDECPQGVDNNNLASCLKSIREEDCGNPLDSVSRLTNCRSGSLCVK